MEITKDHALMFAPGTAAPGDGLRLRSVARNWSACLDEPAQGRWRRLAERATEPNPFFEPWYLLPSLAALDPAGTVKLLVVEAGDEWLGLLPLARSPRYYRYPVPHLHAWVHHNAFLGAPLIARGHEAAVWQALLDHTDQNAGLGLFLHLSGVPLGGSVNESLNQVCTASGRQVIVAHREDRAMLASDLAPEAYLEAALSGKKRKELRRQFARLSEEGTVAVERQRDAAGIAEWIAAFLVLEQAGWKGAAGSALACTSQTRSLFAEALTQAAALGRLERLTLTLDGAPIAMLATFLAGEGAFSYKTAFDERFARFSPGVLLQRENLAMLGDPGIAWCDSCAAADHPMIDHLWRERRTIGRLSIAIGRSLRRSGFRLFAAAEQRRSSRTSVPSPAPAGEPT